MHPCNGYVADKFYRYSLSANPFAVGWAKKQEGHIALKITCVDRRYPVHYVVQEALKDLSRSCMILKDHTVYWATLKSRNIYVINLNTGLVEMISKVPGMPVSFLSDEYYFFPDNKSIISRKYSNSSLRICLLPEDRGEFLPFVGPVVFFRKLTSEEDLYFSVEGYVIQSRCPLRGLIKGGLLSDISFSMSGDKLTLTAPKRFGSEECSFDIDLKTLMHEKRIVSMDPKRERYLFEFSEGVDDLKKV